MASFIDIRHPIDFGVIGCAVTDRRMALHSSKVLCELDMFRVTNILIPEKQYGV